jgi:hypothetical protein
MLSNSISENKYNEFIMNIKINLNFKYLTVIEVGYPIQD